MIFKILKNSLFIAILPSLIFLIMGIWTLSNYGMNWDEPIHFMRGQAYLHYFLSGEKDYKSIPPYPRFNSKFNTSEYQGNTTFEEVILKKIPPNQKVRRSYYQSDDYTFNEFIKMEEGHPPLGGILAALTNKIFYQNLKIMGDIESYHLFEVLASFAIVLIVSLFVFYNFGTFPAVVAGIALASYPLFFGESHLNIKDPPLAAFFGITLITFYFGIIKNNWKLIILSAIFFGMSMNIKFNVLFLPAILGPWLLIYLFKFYLENKRTIKSIKDFKKLIKLSLLISIILYPLVAALTFYILWPFLWSDPVNNFLKILDYYKHIGTGTPGELKDYLIKGWNSYPLIWIVYTTPIPVLILAVAGILGSIYELIFKKRHLAILLLLWFIVPILRVSFPGSSIYGGVRQIMEYIPALAVLAGAGAYYLSMYSRSLSRVYMVVFTIEFLIISSLFYVLYEMVRIHPNQNVYFNQLIGGLSGAKARDIPYWGNSYGNVYQQGIEWLNANAEPNARLGFPVSTGGNLARVKLRPDISYWNAYWSGPNMGGEYEMELDFDWSPKQWYSYAYYDTFVEPVFVAQVDEVPLLKIWKNDLDHTRPGYRKEVDYNYEIIKEKMQSGQLFLDLGRVISLTRLTIEHDTNSCEVLKGGYIETSEDVLNWQRDPETIAAPQVPVNVNGWDEDTFVFMFAARKARFILLDTQLENSCILKQPQIKVQGLSQNP